VGIVDNAKIYLQKYHPRRALARLWRSGERAVDIWDTAEEALPHMPTARATTAPVSIYDLVHTGSNQPTDSADEAKKKMTAVERRPSTTAIRQAEVLAASA
jgi:hypothetical protein